MDQQTPTDVCVLCNKLIEDVNGTVKITEKGANTIKEANKQRGTSIDVIVGQVIHSTCRLDFTNKKSIAGAKKRKSEENSAQEPSLRSKQPAFNFPSHCLYCTLKAVDDHGCYETNVYRVSTWNGQDAILRSCDIRKDEWANAVRSRVVYAQDLPAVDAIYHKVCDVNFRTGRNIPTRFDLLSIGKKQTRTGRIADASREDAFLIVIDEFIENEEEQTTILDLVERMAQICSDPYSDVYMKKKLVDSFGDSLVITQIGHVKNVVTVRKTAAKIIHEFYKNHNEQKADIHTHKKNILRSAAALIKADIDAVKENRNMYPDLQNLGDIQRNLEYVPLSLRLFLQEIFRGKKMEHDLKVAAIGQSIMQQTRPRSIMAPMQFGLTMQLHWKYGSRELVDNLNSRGFCLSYDEACLFKACAANHQMDPFSDVQGSFCHVIADNVDHNIITLNGKDTYHGMGLMYTATPGISPQYHIPRTISRDVSKPTSIEIKRLRKLGKSGESMMYKTVAEINEQDDREHLDTLWKITFPFRVNRPGYSGFMQTVTKGVHPGKASFHFLPMVDLDPTNMSCIYSSLSFINTQCIKYNVIPVVTFDQPLWFKAKQITTQEQELQKMILNLGGFHTVMSFLGSIGCIMKSSGLIALLELVYACNTVKYMLVGKAYERSIRGHFLVDAALNAIIVKRIQFTKETEQAMNNSLEMFDKAIEFSNEALVSSSEDISAVSLKMEEIKNDFQKNPNGKLWVQYMKMIDILRSALKAQRTGQFLLYLKVLQNMLPFFAASGHNNYTKSVHLYLQDMVHLKESNPEVYSMFISGHLFVRRSDRFWAGLPTDLVIEQILMKSLKIAGGLTHGRGMEETQRTRWLQSMPAFAHISKELENVYKTRNDIINKDMMASRRKKDQADTESIMEYLEEHDPFVDNESLFDISSGISAPASNVHEAEEVGNAILRKMEGQQVSTFVFRKKDHVKLMGEKVVADGEEIAVDTQVLFQRLLVIANNTDLNLEEVLRYELSTYPPSLFESSGLLNSANKPQLVHAIAKHCKLDEPISPPEPECHVVDGGSLIQRVEWKKGETYDEIFMKYIIIAQRYRNPVVVFDGYMNKASTKGIAHKRRSEGKTAPDVLLSLHLPFKFDKKTTFLANHLNKQKFINMLSEKMQKNGIETIHSEADADVLIVETAVNLATKKVTYVIAEDTDILVLLCHHLKPSTVGLFMKSDKTTSKYPLWDIKATCDQLGNRCCKFLPFLHALCGSDTTSRLYGIGKAVVIKKQEQLFKDGAVFLLRNSSKNAIKEAGAKALVHIYGGLNESLDELRKKKFGEKVVKSIKSVEVQTLPPTSDAAKYHSYRVYHQTQVWMGNNNLMPKEWGWKLQGESLMPETMDHRPAPDALLKILRCKCKGYCDTQLCTCKKHGLYCTDSCVECMDGFCVNSPADEEM